MMLHKKEIGEKDKVIAEMAEKSDLSLKSVNIEVENMGKEKE